MNYIVDFNSFLSTESSWILLNVSILFCFYFFSQNVLVQFIIY